MADFDRDKMNMTPVKEAAIATMKAIDGIQDLPPHLQVLALTSAFKLMIERFGVEAQDAFTVADNIMNDALGKRAEFKAVRQYLHLEV